LSELFRWHGRSLVVGFCIAALWAVPVYVLIIFLPTYVQRPDTYGFSASQAFAASLVGNLPLVLGCMVFGHLSDRLGRRPMLALSATLQILTWLQRSGGPSFAPAWYVMLTAAIALLAIPFHKPLSAERWAATGRFVSSRSSC
jgi:MFS family permease